MQDGPHFSRVLSSPQFSRREFLAVTAGVSGALLLSDPTSAIEVGAELPTHRFRIRRDADLVVLELSFVNFEASQGWLRAIGAGQSLIIARFPPQNLAEAVFDRPASSDDFEINPIQLDDGAPANSPKPPIRSYLSGPSWVVFAVPDATTLPLSRQAAARFQRSGPWASFDAKASVFDIWLRAMAEWKIRIPYSAANPGTADKPSTPSMPRPNETCLEIPFRLFISPTSENTRVATSSDPKWLRGDILPDRPRELWHAAILARDPLKPATLPQGIDISAAPELAPPTQVLTQARAVFSPDYQPQGEPSQDQYYPGKMMLSLMKWTRHRLVSQMAQGNGWIDAEHLILSSLGCDANLSYTSQTTFERIIASQIQAADPTQTPVELSIWKHRIVIGRDALFIEATPGFLFPFVFPCFFVRLTQRRFAAYATSKQDVKDRKFSAPGAYLLKEYYIVCVDPVKQYAKGNSPLSFGMPLKRITLTEPRSPLLQDPYRRFRIAGDLDPAKINRLTADEKTLVRPCQEDRASTLGQYFVPRPLQPCTQPGASSDGVRWSVEQVDTSGNKSNPSACLLFASNVVVGQVLWNSLRDGVRSFPVPAQKITLAPEKATIALPHDIIPKRPNPHPIDPHPLTDAERAPAIKLSDLMRQWSQLRTQILTKIHQGSNAADNARLCADRLLALMQQINRSVNAAEDFAQQLADDLRSFENQAPNLKGAIEDLAKQLTDAAQNQLAQLVGPTWLQIQTVADNIIQTTSSAATALQNKADALANLLQQLARAQQVSSSLEIHSITYDCGRLFDHDGAGNIVGRLTDAQQQVQAILQKASSIDDALATVGLPVGDPSQTILLMQDSYWRDRILGQLQALAGLASRIENQADQLADFRNSAQNYLNQLADSEQEITDLGNQWFHAQLAQADAMIPALKAMALDTPIRTISLVDDYVAQGIDTVRNGVFAKVNQIVNPGLAMAQQVQTGLVQPAALVAGLSRDLGALTAESADKVNALARSVQGIDLSSAIPDAKLFGALPLQSIISQALSSAQVPQINVIDIPEYYQKTFDWSAPVKAFSALGIVTFTPNNDGAPFPVALSLTMTTRIDRPKLGSSLPPKGTVTLDGFLGWYDQQAKQPHTDLDESQYSFTVTLLGLVDINVAYLKMHAEGGTGEQLKPTINPQIQSVNFIGPLKFLEALENILQGLLGDSGFTLDIEPTGLNLAFELALPDIGVGVVALENVSVGAGLLLPFDDKPLKFRFNFCTFEEPFSLSVMCFGGGGFVSVALQTDGHRDLQGALEFGGAFSFNVIVAQGDLFVKAGIYFRMTSNMSDVGGYFRAGGHLEVLALINASVEFLLMLRYQSGGGGKKLFGTASLTISIDLFMFSFDVSVHMEKTIAGSGGSTGDDSRSALNGASPFRLAGFAPNRSTAATATTQSSPGRMWYFKPASAPPPNGQSTPTPNYRFDDAEEWNRKYWSQFAF